MALPLVAGAAVAAFSYWSLKTGQPRPVPMPDDVRDARVEYGAPAQHSGALHPREPSAPLEVPRPVVGDHIPGAPRNHVLAIAVLVVLVVPGVAVAARLLRAAGHWGV